MSVAMGRHKKPPGEALDTFVSVRVSADERERMEAEATKHGQKLSAWARSVLLAAMAARKPRKRGARDQAADGG